MILYVPLVTALTSISALYRLCMLSFESSLHADRSRLFGLPLPENVRFVNAEQFRKSYDALKMRLSLSAEYNTAPQVSETDTNSTESGV